MLKRKMEDKIRIFMEKQNKALLITGAYVKIGLNQEKPYKTRV